MFCVCTYIVMFCGSVTVVYIIMGVCVRILSRDHASFTVHSDMHMWRNTHWGAKGDPLGVLLIPPVVCSYYNTHWGATSTLQGCYLVCNTHSGAAKILLHHYCAYAYLTR